MLPQQAALMLPMINRGRQIWRDGNKSCFLFHLHTALMEFRRLCNPLIDAALQLVHRSMCSYDASPVVPMELGAMRAGQPRAGQRNSCYSTVQGLLNLRRATPATSCLSATIVSGLKLLPLPLFDFWRPGSSICVWCRGVESCSKS